MQHWLRGANKPVSSYRIEGGETAMSFIGRATSSRRAWGRALLATAMCAPALAAVARLVTVVDVREEKREADHDRDVLIAACIDACDAITSQAVRQRLLSALAE